MKKQRFSKIILLGLLTILFTSNIVSVNAKELNVEKEIPVYSSVEEWEASGDTSERVRVQNTTARYVGGYAEYVYVDTKNERDIRVGYHPNFPGWLYVSGYYFSTAKKVTFSPSLSFAWGKISVGISVAASGGQGFYIDANVNKKSRPWVRADISTKRYDMYLYNEFGQLDGIYRLVHKISTASDIQIFIDYALMY